LRILFFERLSSTQLFLTDAIRKGEINEPTAVITADQTDGIGSRENRWIGKKGNFFASVAIDQSMLPDDLPVSATSIYFAFLMKKTVEKLGSGAWVKWPNDLYLQERKIGGCITAKKGDVLIAGIGVNIVDAPLDFGILDLDIAPLELLKAFLRQVESAPSWKQIFSNFSLEFEKSKRFHTHVGNETLDLTDAVLNEDGSLMIGKRRVVSLR
jgi:BirA family biotin operon repressor/biotin-[acetyl-CoA-carboxylase] ligase